MFFFSSHKKLSLTDTRLSKYQIQRFKNIFAYSLYLSQKLETIESDFWNRLVCIFTKTEGKFTDIVYYRTLWKSAIHLVWIKTVVTEEIFLLSNNVFSIYQSAFILVIVFISFLEMWRQHFSLLFSLKTLTLSWRGPLSYGNQLVCIW